MGGDEKVRCLKNDVGCLGGNTTIETSGLRSWP